MHFYAAVTSKHWSLTRCTLRSLAPARAAAKPDGAGRGGGLGGGTAAGGGGPGGGGGAGGPAMGAGAGGWRGGVEESIEGCPGGMEGPAEEQKRDECRGVIFGGSAQNEAFSSETIFKICRSELEQQAKIRTLTNRLFVHVKQKHSKHRKVSYFRANDAKILIMYMIVYWRCFCLGYRVNWVFFLNFKQI